MRIAKERYQNSKKIKCPSSSLKKIVQHEEKVREQKKSSGMPEIDPEIIQELQESIVNMSNEFRRDILKVKISIEPIPEFKM